MQRAALLPGGLFVGRITYIKPHKTISRLEKLAGLKKAKFPKVSLIFLQHQKNGQNKTNYSICTFVGRGGGSMKEAWWLNEGGMVAL
jgi:hypothetical protein